MAQNGAIEEVVKESAFQQLERLQTYLETVNLELINSFKNAKSFSDALAGAKGLRDVQRTASDAAKELEKLNRLQAQTATAQQNLARASAQATAAQLRLTQAQQRAEQQAQRQANATAKASTEYQKLVKEYNEATAAAREAGVVFGVQSGQFTEAANRVRGLRGQLDAIDQPLGNFQRNVGNYSSALVNFGQRAFGAIRTIANILPGLGLSGAFLLIFEGLKYVTQQLGLFNDKVSTAELNLKNFNEVNKAANKVYADQSTTLKILYDAATDTTNAEKDRIAAAKELQRLFPQTFKNSQINSILLGKESEGYQQLTKDLLDNARALAAVDKIKELSAKQLDIDLQKQKIFNALANENARVKPIQQVAPTSGNDASLRAGTFFSKKQQDQSIADQKYANGQRARLALEEQDINRKQLQQQIDFLVNFAGGNKKIAKAITDADYNKLNPKAKEDKSFDDRLKAAKEAEIAILESEKSTYDERISATETFQKVSNRIIAEGVKAGVYRLKEGANMALAIDNEANKQRIEIRKKAEAALAKLLNEGAKNANTALQQEIIDLKDAQDTKLLEIEKYQSDALSATADLYRDGKISAAQYNQQVYDIEKSAAKDRIDLQIETLEKILAVQKENLDFGIGDPKDIQRTQNMITKLRIDSSNLATQVELDNIKKVEQARKNLADLEKQIANESIELIKTIVDGSYQNQLNALSAQSEQIDKNAEAEKKAVDNSLASDEDKANKKNIIDAKAAAQQEVIAAKERDIKTKQAKFDKAASIARIIEATGIAEVQALSYLSNPFTAPLYPAIAAAIGALGALQLATVLATPLPKFAKGTNNSPEGWAHVGEKGTELMIDPSGKMSLTPNSDTLTYLDRGTKIIPNHELIKMMAQPEKLHYTAGERIDLSGVVAGLGSVKKAIQGQKSATTLITKRGWKAQQQRVNDWNTYRKNHFK